MGLSIIVLMCGSIEILNFIFKVLFCWGWRFAWNHWKQQKRSETAETFQEDVCWRVEHYPQWRQLYCSGNIITWGRRGINVFSGTGGIKHFSLKTNNKLTILFPGDIQNSCVNHWASQDQWMAHTCWKRNEGNTCQTSCWVWNRNWDLRQSNFNWSSYLHLMDWQISGIYLFIFTFSIIIR